MKDSSIEKQRNKHRVVLGAAVFVGVLFAHVASADSYGGYNQYGSWGSGNSPFTANAVLRGDSEVPSVSTSAYGSFSSQSTSETSMRFTLSAFNIEDATAAHLHCARIGVNGPVVVSLFSSASSTSVSGVFATSTVTNASIHAGGATCPTPIYDIDDLKLAISRGEIYVNVHSVDYPNGEIRGQLQGSGSFGKGTKKCYCYGFKNYECYNGGTSDYGYNDHDYTHDSGGKASSIPSVPSEPSLPSVPDKPEKPQQPDKPEKTHGKHGSYKKNDSSNSDIASDILSRVRARMGR